MRAWVEVKCDSKPARGTEVTATDGETYTVTYSARYGGRLVDAEGNEVRALWIFYRGRA